MRYENPKLNYGIKSAIKKALSNTNQSTTKNLFAVDWENFFKKTWNIRPKLLGSRLGATKTYSAMDFHSGLSSQLYSVLDIKVFRRHKTLPLRVFTKSISNHERELQYSKLRTLLKSKNSTVVVSFLEKYHSRIAQNCAALSKLFGARVNCNAYFTPAKSQGPRIHWDDHEVLILQISGTKLWKVYEKAPQEELSQKYEYALKTYRNAKLLLETELKPGDLLYIPMGYLHEAKTKSSHSLHLTFGVNSYSNHFKERERWQPLLEWIYKKRNQSFSRRIG